MTPKVRGASRANNVFINVPFDEEYEPLLLALVAGLCGLGRTPRCVIEMSAHRDRLDRIIDLIRECPASIHDLSRVELDPTPPRCPRFNMPFELGLAVAVAHLERRHAWFILESKRHRLQKSLSDVNGHDPFVHGGTELGVLRAIRNMFRWSSARPDVRDLTGVLRDLKQEAMLLKRRNALPSLFEPAAFGQLLVTCQELVRREHQPRWRGR